MVFEKHLKLCAWAIIVISAWTFAALGTRGFVCYPQDLLEEMS